MPFLKVIFLKNVSQSPYSEGKPELFANDGKIAQIEQKLFKKYVDI